MKTLKKIFSVAFVATAFMACEDIPMPYEINLEEDAPQTSIYYNSTALNNGWTAQAESENNPWIKDSRYSQATGYQDWNGDGSKTNEEVKGWLISPAFYTVAETGKVKFYFDYTLRYTDKVSGYADNHKVYVTDNYTGDATTTTWTELTWKPGPSTFADWTTYGSGDIQLPEEFVNKEGVHIAFWFYAPSTASTTWEILNFYIEEGEANLNPGGDEKDPAGDQADVSDADLCVVASAMGLANQGEVNGAVYEGLSFTTDKGTNNNAPKYFINGENIRLYPTNSMTITADKTIDKVVLICTAGSVANGNVESAPGTVAVEDPNITISGINSNKFTITNTDTTTGSASQVRIEKIAIYYAK